MIIVSFDEGAHVPTVRALNLLCGLLCVALWLIAQRSFVNDT